MEHKNDNDTPVGVVAPTALVDTRTELHWLVQVLGAIGDGFLSRAADDSQSNIAWDAARSALVGRPIGNGARLGLVIATAELIIISADDKIVERSAASGKDLAELLTWAGGGMAQASGVGSARQLTTRDYDMPAHPVSGGACFALDEADQLAELARWFANATAWLEAARSLDSRASEVRCWPHHFDVGGIIMLAPDKPFEQAAQMGFGWSPGDGSYAEPYFCVTPFPVPDALPTLPSGHWHRDGFTGAILTGSEVVRQGDARGQAQLVDTFLRETIHKTLPAIEP